MKHYRKHTEEEIAGYKAGVKHYYNRDFDKASKCFIRAGARGINEASSAWGIMQLKGYYTNGVNAASEYNAFYSFRKSTEGHSPCPIGMYQLSRLLRKDIGINENTIQRDLEAADEWLKKSAIRGYVKAENEWATVLFLKHNDGKASYEYHSRAARQGNTESMNMCAYMLTVGAGKFGGPKRDYAGAIEWLKFGIKHDSLASIHDMRYIANGLEDHEYITELNAIADKICEDNKVVVKVEPLEEIRGQPTIEMSSVPYED